MVTLRCTEKLIKRLKLRPSASLVASSSMLGDWYAAPFSVGHTRLAMCVSERSLLAVFVRARGLPLLVPDFREAVVTLLGRLGLSESVVGFEREQLADIQIGKTESRSVLGSMNDFAIHGRVYLESTANADLLEMALRLSEIPCSPLAYKSPKVAVRELLGAA